MIDPIASLLGEWSQTLSWASILFRILPSVRMPVGNHRLRAFQQAPFCGTAHFYSYVACNDCHHPSRSSSCGEHRNEAFLLSSAGIIGVAVISVYSLFVSSQSQIRGLTTAVRLWTCAILGLTAGAGCYTATFIAFAVLLCCLACFPSLERYLKNRSNSFEIHLELKSPDYLQNFVSTIRRLGLKIDDIEANPAYAGSGLSVYSITVSIRSAELKKYKTHTEIIEAQRSLDYISHIEEM